MSIENGMVCYERVVTMEMAMFVAQGNTGHKLTFVKNDVKSKEKSCGKKRDD